MKSVTTKIDTTAGKEEEIAMLKSIHTAFAGSQMYLESLFSPGLVEWVAGEIRKDFPPDVIGYYKVGSEQAEVAHLFQVNQLEQQLREEKKARIEAERCAADAKASIEYLNRTITDLRQTVGRMDEYYAEVQERLQYANVKANKWNALQSLVRDLTSES